MKYAAKNLICMIVCLVLLLALPGCTAKPSEPVNIDALFGTLLQKVTFATELTDAGEDAALFFPEFPEGTRVCLFIGSGYYADEAALITLSDFSQAKDAMAAVEEHLAQKRHQFLNYIPEEVSKIDNARIWQDATHIILCVTGDHATAAHILENAGDISYTVPPTTEPTTVPTAEPATEPAAEPTAEAATEPTAESTAAPTEPPTEPALQSESGKVHWYESGVIRVDTHAYEPYAFIPEASAKYAAVISEAAELLTPHGITVYDLLIPTAIGIVLPDDIAASSSVYTDQGAAIEAIFSWMSDKVVPVNCYETLRLHRDEYLYFRTDHHWNGPGAYYAYESFCRVKGIEPYTMQERPAYEFDNFMGTLYFLSSDKDPVLSENRDTVLAFDTASNVSMYYYDKAGVRNDYPVIADVTDWAAGAKYSCFAGADQPLAVFSNHDLDDGSACIVIKESFGNALMSYIADHYQTVYEIDYRYWNGDLTEFALEHGVTDVIFANNLALTGNSSGIGMIKRLF